MSLSEHVRNRVTRVRQRGWRARPYTSDERHVFIGGTPRSGTTLVRRILDRHPSLCCGPETSILLPGGMRIDQVASAYRWPAADLRALMADSPSQGAFVDAFAERYRRQRDRPRWAEKTPLNVLCFGWALERFPEARVVHVVRDGRDVVCSMRQHPDRRWVDGVEVKELRPQSVDAYMRRWVRDTEAGVAQRDDPRYLEVRYEDLVADPERVMRELVEALGEQWLPELLVEKVPKGGKRAHANSRISTASVGRWRQDLTVDERRRVQAIGRPLLERLGYPAA
ncbi:MAG: sulfotransferase [Chloroflexota bacterium]